MSTVTTFTVRDLNRQPAKILAAVRKFGSAEVRTRTGEVFTIAPRSEKKSKRKAADFPNFSDRWRRMRELGNVPPTKAENERINRIIAGEE